MGVLTEDPAPSVLDLVMRPEEQAAMVSACNWNSARYTAGILHCGFAFGRWERDRFCREYMEFTNKSFQISVSELTGGCNQLWPLDDHKAYEWMVGLILAEYDREPFDCVRYGCLTESETRHGRRFHNPIPGEPRDLISLPHYKVRL